jgi:peptidoglycan/LPS O-acetylase OafA/YrhL
VTASADASRDQPRPGLAFFCRRFRRIFPPYWLWLLVVAVAVVIVEFYVAPGFFATAFVPNPARFALPQWFGNLTLTESWRWNVTGGVESALLSPSWTLCYEEQFYALVGLCLIFCRRYFFQALACISVAVLIGMVLLPSAGVPTWGLFLDGKWLMFAAGVLAYYALNYVPSAKVPLYCIPIGLGVLAAVANPGNLLKPLVNEPNQSYLAAFVLSLVIIALRKWDERLLQSRLARPLRFCGERCYSIYLVHWPTVTVVSWAFNQLGVRKPFLVFFIGLPICVGAAVGLGWLFHRWVERRFLSSRRRAPAHPAVTAP